ncbi:dTDP-4-dehydrorhamnose reductase [Motiliproteus sediminis]|uniref:dTDP-4-dehydrorhamnose reductase n=1 Tax=Motiliproteus sediminis TaxID=1468178 RepID=UPI001AEFFE72|nr:dTDP-4-dehydrorhamnose reductase [Motiliproteus sediminis]
MKILLTGADGQLGRCIQDRAGDHELVALNRQQLDITDQGAVTDCVRLHRPDAVINAAAYTNVDQAESEPNLAYAVNRDGPAHIAVVCAELDIPLIHISTDYVFDGTKRSPYTPDDNPNPINVYGASKLAGEEAIRRIWEKHLIIRTSWLFSEYGHNFVKTMLRLAKERDEIRVVDDQIGCPTYAGDLAEVVLRLADRNVGWGRYHFCGGVATSWYEFSGHIFRLWSEVSSTSIPALKPVGAVNFLSVAIRPNYSVLDSNTFVELVLNDSDSLDRVIKNVLLSI